LEVSSEYKKSKSKILIENNIKMNNIEKDQKVKFNKKPLLDFLNFYKNKNIGNYLDFYFTEDQPILIKIDTDLMILMSI
jgi:hypothetical protein